MTRILLLVLALLLGAGAANGSPDAGPVGPSAAPAESGPSPSAPAAAPAGSAEERFAAANADFAAGRYEEAIDGFRSIVAMDGYSAPLLFDLGNAYFRAGRLGEAILWYERARLLAPGDPDVQANLRQARRAANLPPRAEGGWLRFARSFGADALAVAASAALFLAAILAVAARLARRALVDRSTLRRGLRWAAATALAVAVGSAALCAVRLREADRAVVLDPDAALLAAPYEEATAAAPLAPGETVRIEQRHGDFALVRTPSGRSGWVRAEAVEPLWPAAEASGNH